MTMVISYHKKKVAAKPLVCDPGPGLKSDG